MRDAGRRRDEVLHGQAGHLHEIGHRAFAAIVLPVGVGDEADGGVEGEFGLDGGHAGGIERQAALEPLQDIEHQEAGEVEEQHAPPHRRSSAAPRSRWFPASVKAALDRAEERRKECALAVEDAVM